MSEQITQAERDRIENNQDTCAGDLAIAARRVLNALKNGRNPTFEQLGRLEATLYPFEAMKICGHPLLEDCDCYA